MEREIMTNHEFTYSNEPFLGGKLDIDLWSEILPHLWLGGTADTDYVGDKHYEFDRQNWAIKPRHFDSVYTFFSWANPVYWEVKEFRFGYFDSADTGFDVNAFKRIALMAHADWKRGERVLLRCQAGLNRSSLICALVLMIDGQTAEQAIDLMRAKRHDKVLFNDKFVEWLLSQDLEFWRN
jgi:hypothetical protein